jgi:hypothetical protein
MEVGPVMQRRLAALDALYEHAATSPIRIEAGYTHYLPCVLLLRADAATNLAAHLASGSETRALQHPIAGILYVGPAGVRLHIIPRTARAGGGETNAQAAPAAAPNGNGPSDIDMGVVRQVTAASIALPQSRFARLARTRPHHVMAVRWPTGQAIMAIPAIGATLPRLHRCLDEIRWGAARS